MDAVSVVAAVLACAFFSVAHANVVGLVPGPKAQPPLLTAAQLGVIINDADRLSVAIGAYYQKQRSIPAANLIHVKFNATRSTMSRSEFATVSAAVLAQTPPGVQAYALTWMTPFRVECMSITTAFALGFNEAFCGEGCTTTRWSPYFNAETHRPFNDLAMRPAMSIAARNFEQARQLIDRGVASDGAAPRGKGYLVATDDVARNVRASGYRDAALMVNGRVPLEVVKAPALSGRSDVLFYFIGAVTVPDLETNHFLPGAVADHLTSFGGELTGSSQMSSLRWLEAGATGSYGTVAEPCNFPGKFPNPGMLMRRYLAGETLIESYWKSVAMPGQGIFIGEPLARPFGVRR